MELSDVVHQFSYPVFIANHFDHHCFLFSLVLDRLLAYFIVLAVDVSDLRGGHLGDLMILLLDVIFGDLERLRANPLQLNFVGLAQLGQAFLVELLVLLQHCFAWKAHLCARGQLVIDLEQGREVSLLVI